MPDQKCKLLVIGAGPGGYVCAIRAAQQGVDTIVVESKKPGGTCLNVGCIPSKALLHVADEFNHIKKNSNGGALGISAAAPSINLADSVKWKNGIVSRLNTGVSGLLKKSGARHIEGTADFLDGKTVVVTTPDARVTIRADSIVIATGSEPVELESLPFSEHVLSSTQALALEQVPETMAVVGGGYIGLEIGTAYAKLGSTVTVIEAADRILPQYDADLTEPVMQGLIALGIEVMTNTRAGVAGKDTLEIETSSGVRSTIAATKILVAVGRRPCTKGCSLEELSLTMDTDFIQIDEKCQTSMRGVYAIGDVTGEPMLAHRAMAQGEMVADIVAGKARSWDKVSIPAVCFTDPEIVTVGLPPDQAADKEREITVGQFPFQANGRAMTTESEAGFVRVVSTKQHGVVLGIQAVGANVSELSAAFTLALEMGACAEDIAATVHAHPTLSESFAEACMQLTGKALHI